MRRYLACSCIVNRGSFHGMQLTDLNHENTLAFFVAVIQAYRLEIPIGVGD
jgi:hypothetical protein